MSDEFWQVLRDFAAHRAMVQRHVQVLAIGASLDADCQHFGLVKSRSGWTWAKA